MAAADAIASSAGAGLLAGGTPFGWASLASGFLNGAAGGTGGPSQASQSGLTISSDFSGWTVGTSGSRANATAGDRGATGSGQGLMTDISTPALLVAGIVLLVLLKRKR